VLVDVILPADNVSSPGGGPVALTQLPRTVTRSGLFLPTGFDVWSSVALRCTELGAARCLGVSGLVSAYSLYGQERHTNAVRLWQTRKYRMARLIPNLCEESCVIRSCGAGKLTEGKFCVNVTAFGRSVMRLRFQKLQCEVATACCCNQLAE
jgi:hypothetical protein